MLKIKYNYLTNKNLQELFFFLSIVYRKMYRKKGNLAHRLGSLRGLVVIFGRLFHHVHVAVHHTEGPDHFLDVPILPQTLQSPRERSSHRIAIRSNIVRNAYTVNTHETHPPRSLPTSSSSPSSFPFCFYHANTEPSLDRVTVKEHANSHILIILRLPSPYCFFLFFFLESKRLNFRVKGLPISICVTSINW